MAIEKFAQVQVNEPIKKKRRRYNADVTMLVVGAEEGRVLLHQTEEQSYKISGEITVADLREADIDVEDWVARGLIAPLGQLAERENETDPAVLFENAGDYETEEIELTMRNTDVKFNDELGDDTAPTNIVSETVPDIDKVQRVDKPKIKAKR